MRRGGALLSQRALCSRLLRSVPWRDGITIHKESRVEVLFFIFFRTEPRLLIMCCEVSLRLVARFFLTCKGVKEVFFKFDGRKKKKNMSRVAAELLNKSEILIIVCCIVRHDGNDLFGVYTFLQFFFYGQHEMAHFICKAL